MNNKFLAVAKKILTEPSEITETYSSDSDEIYFLYKGAAFSILQRAESKEWGRYSLYLYPKETNLQKLAYLFDQGQEEHVKLVGLHAKELPSTEGDVLERLFKLLTNKDSGVDDLLDSLLR